MSKQVRISGKIRNSFRSDKLGNWESENPVLLKGEFGVVTNPLDSTERVKIGDGVTAWNNLGWWYGPTGPKGEKGEQGIKGEKGDKGDTAEVDYNYLNTAHANALKAKSVGKTVVVNDVSPLEHNLNVKLKSDVLTDFSSVKVLRYGKNIYDLYSESVKSLGGANGFDAVSKNNGLLTITSDNKKITTQYHCPIFTLYEAELPKGTYTFSFKCGFENSVPTAAKPNYLAFYLDGVVNTADFLTDGSYNYTFNLENKATVRIDFYKHVFYAQEDGLGSEYASDTIYNAKFWDIQLELGENATEYEDYKQVQEVTANADGSVNGLLSIAPNMTLISYDDVIIECEYNKDINCITDKLGYLNTQLGDIETALDNIIAEQESIIAIQNALIGGETV